MRTQNWFEGYTTVASVKSRYRTLAKRHHPDLGGDTRTMQDINAQYHAVLQALDGQESFDKLGKQHYYRYRATVEQGVMDKIAEILRLRLPNITIELIGTWVWVSGDTRPVKDSLKAAKLRWHSKRQLWYWHGPTYRRKYSGIPTEQLRWMYGSRGFESDERQAIA